MTKEETFAYIKAYLDGDTAVGNIIPLRSVLESAIKYLSEPSLTSNIDEAAQKIENYYDVGEEHGHLCCHRGDIKDAFKAGAEWMAGQGVKAHCIESANPVSESPDVKLHLITLLYEENEHIPYVRGGDNIDIIILKK